MGIVDKKWRAPVVHFDKHFTQGASKYTVLVAIVSRCLIYSLSIILVRYYFVVFEYVAKCRKMVYDNSFKLSMEN